MPDVSRRRTVVEIPWRTLFKVIAAAALVWLWLQLWQTVLLVLVAVLLAVTLDPVVRWIARRGLPRWGAATLVTFVLFGTLIGFLWLTWTSLSSQAGLLGHHIEQFVHQIVSRVPPAWRNAFGAGGADGAEALGSFALKATRALGSAAVVFVLALILTLYLLIEGTRTYRWLVSFVPRGRRARVEQTLEECRQIVFAYVAGNVVTSIFAALFVGIVLSVLQVPASLLLAVLAGLFDFVPVLGFIASVAPAALLALTVSTRTALLVVALYIAYHGAENYVIAPKVYGDRLRLSNVAVVLAFVVGAELAGVVGALIALPLAAIYPVVEQKWLRGTIGTEVVEAHRALERKSA
jgi:predicted PurR-regulated permease PerM